MDRDIGGGVEILVLLVTVAFGSVPFVRGGAILGILRIDLFLLPPCQLAGACGTLLVFVDGRRSTV